MVGAVVIGAGLYTSKKAADSQKQAAATAAQAQTQAAETATDAQLESTKLAIDEQRRQFDEMKELLAPYVGAGTPALQQLAQFAEIAPGALEQQQALAGLGGAEAQRAAIQQIEESPFFQEQIRMGEEALLQNAAATGGLRGGNLQSSLAQFRPSLLSQAISDQYTRLGGLTSLGAGATQNLATIGQASATGQAAQGQAMASNIANQLAASGRAQAQGALNVGQAQAQQALAGGRASAGQWGDIGGLVGQYAGYRGIF